MLGTLEKECLQDVGAEGCFIQYLARQTHLHAFLPKVSYGRLKHHCRARSARVSNLDNHTVTLCKQVNNQLR